MKQLSRASLIFMMLTIILWGCTNKAMIPKDKFPDIDIPTDELNQRLKITSPDWYGNSFKNNKELVLDIHVLSSDEIAFTIDYSVRLFAYQDNQWVELQNKMGYDGDRSKFITYCTSSDFGTVGIVPYQSNLTKPVPVRIFLFGNLVRDGKVTSQKTAAYFDFMLKP